MPSDTVLKDIYAGELARVLVKRQRTARVLRDLHTERNALSEMLDREATDHQETIAALDEARAALARAERERDAYRAALGTIANVAAENVAVADNQRRSRQAMAFALIVRYASAALAGRGREEAT